MVLAERGLRWLVLDFCHTLILCEEIIVIVNVGISFYNKRTGMKLNKKSLRKNLVINFSILVFCLLAVISGVWAFFWREQLLQAGIPEAEVLYLLLGVGRFVFVFILVLVVVAVLFGMIFTDAIFQSLRKLAEQFRMLKTASFTSRIVSAKDEELNDVVTAANEVIERLEKEISDALFKAMLEKRHFIEEQNLLVSEQGHIYEEKMKLEYVLGRITDGIILLNRNRNIVLLNSAAEEVIGFDQNEAAGKLIGEVINFHEEGREVTMQEYAPAKRTNYLLDDAFVKKCVWLNGPQTTEKLVDLICVRLTLIHTQDLGYMIVLHDLTEEVEVEKQRSKLLSSFASELKQPFSIISNYLSFFNKQGSTVMSDKNKYLEGMKAGISHLSLIIENLLTASMIDDNTLKIEKAAVDLFPLIRDVISVVNPLIEERGISLRYEEQKDFAALVMGDQNRIHQIILNLLLNAIFYTPTGGSISVSISQSDGEIILRVQDSGVGILTEEMKNLFNKFFVGSSVRPLGSGIGLGLYVCKNLVELHQGKIWVDSVGGKGTLVSVSLPKA